MASFLTQCTVIVWWQLASLFVDSKKSFPRLIFLFVWSTKTRPLAADISVKLSCKCSVTEDGCSDWRIWQCRSWQSEGVAGECTLSMFSFRLLLPSFIMLEVRTDPVVNYISRCSWSTFLYVVCYSNWN